MKKVVKLFTWIFALFFAVALLALGALYVFADPNKLKPVIADEVLKRTGYHLVFDGDLSWSLYPQVGVKAQHITLTEPNQQKPFIDLKRVNIAVEPLQIIFGGHSVGGEVHISDLTLLNVHMTSALVGLNYQGGAIIFQPLQATLYGGSLSGYARGKDFSSVPAWNWDVTLNHVDMLPLLLDANGANTKLKISGTGQLKISASTRGTDPQQLMSNLNGATDFSVTNGKVEGIDIINQLEVANSLINKDSSVAQQASGVTSYDAMTGSILINNGVAQTTNLSLTAPDFKASGQGQYNIPERNIDLALKVNSPKVLNGEWYLPINIHGPLSSPSIQLDLAEINKQVAQHEVSKVKAEANELIKKRLPGKAGEFLQNVIGN